MCRVRSYGFSAITDVCVHVYVCVRSCARVCRVTHHRHTRVTREHARGTPTRAGYFLQIIQTVHIFKNGFLQSISRMKLL